MENKAKRIIRNKTSRKIMLVTVSVALGIMFIMMGMQVWLNNRIAKALESEPFNIEGGAYTTSVGRVGVNIFSRSIELNTIEVRTNPSYLADDNGPLPKFSFSIARLDVKGIKYKRGGNGRKPVFSAGSIIINSPELEYEGVPKPRSKSKEGKELSLDSLKSQLVGNFNRFYVREFSVHNGKAYLGIWDGGERRTVSAGDMDITVSGFESGGAVVPDPGRLLSSERITLALGDLRLPFKRGAMNMVLSGLKADSGDGSVGLEKFALLPRFGKEEYAYEVGDHSDWLHIELNDINGYDTDFIRLVREGVLVMDSVSIDGGSIESYKDRNVPTEPKIKPLLYEPFQRMALEVHIPRINVRGLDAGYDERSLGAPEAGRITFSDINAELYDVTNRASRPDQFYRLDARANVFGQAPVSVSMDVPVDPQNDAFKVKGSVGRMDMTLANGLVGPLIGLRVDSGTMESLKFDIEGDSVKSSVTTIMIYSDLHASLYKGHDPADRRKLITVLADRLVKDSNPDSEGLRTGKGSFTRDPYKSHFNYMWKTVFMGLMGGVIM